MDEATSNLMEPLKSVEPKPDSLEGKIVEEARQAEQETSTDHNRNAGAGAGGDTGLDPSGGRQGIA